MSLQESLLRPNSEHNLSVSILISARPYYPELITNAIMQATNLADTNLHNYEFWVKIDHHDFATLTQIKSLIQQGLPIHYLIADGHAGRLGINYYTNLLAWNASGKLLWYWSDELRIQTKNWNKNIENWANRYHSKLVVLYPTHTFYPGQPFGFAPVISRRWLNETGRFSYHPAIDSYLDFVSGPLRGEKLIHPYVMNDIVAEEIPFTELASCSKIPSTFSCLDLEKQYLVNLFMEPSLAAHWDLNDNRSQEMFSTIKNRLRNILLKEGPVL